MGDQSTSIPTSPPPRSLNVNTKNRGSVSVSVSDYAHQGILDSSNDVPTPKSSNHDDFEKTVQELDSEIHGFDKVTKEIVDLSTHLSSTDQAQSAHTNLPSGPPSKMPLMQPMKPNPLRDQSNMDLDHNNPKPHSEGYLVLLWKNSVRVEVVLSSPNHIDALVGVKLDEQWRFTGVYGFPNSARKHETWSLIRSLHLRFTLSWLCAGDFNELIWSHKKLGLGPRQDYLMKEFHDVLDECGFMDLGYVGDKFTWRGKRAGGLVLERLDRAVATNGWVACFSGFKVQHLHTHSSDHKAILINPEGIIPRPNRPFKFEQIWLREGGCSDTMNKAWGSTSQNANMLLVAGNIQVCGEKLTTWSLQSFGSIKCQIEKKGKLLAKIKIEAANRKVDYELVKTLRAEVNDLLDKESQMWQQRSRALFLKCGDHNTSYFHNKASHRFRRNRIAGLRKASNLWCTEDNLIRNISCENDQSLFTSSQPLDFSVILEAVKPSVTDDMNAQILRPFLREEVEEVVKQMEPTTASCPDDMPPLFYQSFWSLIGEDIISAVLDCLNNCKIPNEINFTNITLIPKVKSPELITDFRPIRLCNVVYKIVSKVLANRLRDVLPSVISENQSAF
ncbi:uncharacterized protein LOC142638768 [Castanea sativa]|uniref:uncharacterized protein LOC142638768 n=1 Tax=Castanea sativa TaxID=21020 RepID=UPI003F650BF7